MNYHLGKANETADTLSQYFQRSVKKIKTLKTENTKILY